MKTWGFIVAISICMIGAIFLNISSRSHDMGTLVYIDYDEEFDGRIRSETSYLPDSDGHSVFSVCHTRDRNSSLCKEVKGVIHGVQRWYSDGMIVHEDFYDYGNLVQAIAYNKNGLKQKECFFKNQKLSQKNYYSEENGNPLTTTILYRKDEKIKRYYFNNKIQREERYKDNRLVSRRTYDSDGLLQRLEEYNTVGSFPESFDYFFENLDVINPYLFNNRDTPVSPSNKPSYDIRSGIWI